MRIKRAVLVFVLLGASVGWTQTDEEPKPYKRNVRVGVSALAQSKKFEKTGTAGVGPFAVYEYILKPDYYLGILLSYSYFPGSVTMTQLGYGLTMKHYIWEDSRGWIHPYFLYGLLMKVTRLSDRKGSATSHDTKLTAGTDLQLGVLPLFMDLSYHYSRASFFEVATLRFDHWNVTVGGRWRF